MRAAFIRETGAPSVIQVGDLPAPTAGAGQVLVRVKAVAVNPIDTYIRAGAVAMPLSYPYVIGADFAGEVVSVGAGVTTWKPGDRVWGSNQGLMGRQGCFSEYAAIGAEWCYPTPTGQSDAQAAAGALTGITAHLGLFRTARLAAGETVFVNGGTGGVGSAVVQLAKAAGAFVVTTAGSEEKVAAAKALGADVALNYKDPGLDDAIRAAVADRGGVKVWFETLREPTLERTISMMAMGGRIVLMAGRQARPDFPLGAFYTRDLSLVGFAMFNATAAEQQQAGAGLNAFFACGKWQPRIAMTLPLEEAAHAHQLQQENTLDKAGTLSGKIVLTLE
jgi:NADPH2:quinone reductase